MKYSSKHTGLKPFCLLAFLLAFTRYDPLGCSETRNERQDLHDSGDCGDRSESSGRSGVHWGKNQKVS